MTTLQLTDDQIEQLHNLIDETILPALSEDGICSPDMSDIDEEDPTYDTVWSDRHEALIDAAIKYMKNNM